MKVIKSLLAQGLEMEEMMRANLKRVFALDCHVSNYMMSLVYLRKYDPLLPKKRFIYKKLMMAENVQDQRKYFDFLWRFKPQEDAIILECLQQIEKDKEKQKDFGLGKLWRPYTIGVRTFEFEAHE